MAERTNIEWADGTANFWWGCTKVSPACLNCYAESLARRWRHDVWGDAAGRKLQHSAAMKVLRKLVREARADGRIRRVFVNSMSDFFEDRVDLDAPRLRAWQVFHHLANDDAPVRILLLTKRPDVMRRWAEEHGWPSICWAGTTVEDQRRADERIQHLVQVPAGVRFLSMEPLLSPVGLQVGHSSANLAGMWVECPECRGTGGRPARAGEHGGFDCVCDACGGARRVPGVHWVIAGGESGPKARPSHPAWFRSIRDQCESAGVAFHFKQWGAWMPDRPQPGQTDAPGSGWWAMRHDGSRPSGPVDNDVQWMRRVGKKRAGRMLDGRTHDEVPDA